MTTKEIAMPLKDKEDVFGNHVLVCPNCENAAIVNPYRRGKEIYPYCPWCGQKLKRE